MNKIKTEHHSVADWDFTPGAGYALNATQFVSPPTSLMVAQYNGSHQRPAILCRIAETLCIPQGEVRTWHRTWSRAHPFRLYFRNQHALGGADYENTYYWDIANNLASLHRVVAGGLTPIGNFVVSFANNTWYHWRTVYWNGTTPGGTPTLAVMLFLEVAGEWVQQGVTLYDTDNQWKDSEINRSGLGYYVPAGVGGFFDDTEIWGAV